MLLKILFYLFALILVYSAIRVISAKNPMVAVLHLVLAFIATSLMWFLIEAEFLALSLIIIYCGAVMVFFLFAVMMLDIPYATVKDGFTRFMPLGVVVAAVIILEMVVVASGKNGLLALLYSDAFTQEMGSNSANGNAYDLGMLLYTEYLYAIEIVALILLSAMIVAIRLTQRSGPLRRKDVNVSKQIAVDPSTRVEVIGMPSSTMAPYAADGSDEVSNNKEEQK